MSQESLPLTGKKALIVGVANQRSLAWGIAKKLHADGAEIAMTFQSERFGRKVKMLGEEVGAQIVQQCDLTSPEDLRQLATTLEDKWDGLDIVIHSVAYADAKNLQGRLLDVSEENYSMALNISAYTLISLSKSMEGLLSKKGGSVVALSYYGAHKVFPGYHLMGVAKAALEAIIRYLAHELGEKKIRVNAISAGAVKTLAASGVPGIQSKLDMVEEKAPLKENISNEDVGDLAAFLCGQGSSKITGSTLYVDSGINILGV